MYTSQFYQDESGNKPFSDWLARLKKKDRIAAVKIDTRLDRAESGNFGDHKFERDGVWAVRRKLRPQISIRQLNILEILK